MANGRDFSRPPPSLWILLAVTRTGSPLRRLAGDRRLDRRFLRGQPAVCQSTKDAADQRRYPEHPQLLKRYTALDQCRTGAARRIDAGVGDRDADQVD